MSQPNGCGSKGKYKCEFGFVMLYFKDEAAGTIRMEGRACPLCFDSASIDFEMDFGEKNIKPAVYFYLRDKWLWREVTLKENSATTDKLPYKITWTKEEKG